LAAAYVANTRHSGPELLSLLKEPRVVDATGQ
jgi:hypothetical protein